jgi:hypothetical protein
MIIRSITNIKNILIAIDSFKGCLTSLEAGEAAKSGIIRVYTKESSSCEDTGPDKTFLYCDRNKLPIFSIV